MTTLLDVPHDPLWFSTTALFGMLYLGATALYITEMGRRCHTAGPAWLALGYWLTVHPALLWIVVRRFDTYADSAPVVVAALNLPSALSAVLLRASNSFRRTIDRLSLRFLIETVEAAPRILVGITFLVGWRAGRLPGYFAWVAGPGDVLSGVLAFAATRWALKPLLARGASADEIAKACRDLSRDEARAYRRRVRLALGIILFGMLDFVAAPASSLFSTAMGEVPEAMGRVPLTMVPVCLVPTAFTLEVWAWYQLWKLQSWLGSVKAKEQ